MLWKMSLGLRFDMKNILLILLLTLSFVSVVESHHIRGIPHYSYRDNYPETPIYELTKNVSQYEVTFTYYKIPGQTAFDLAVYVRDTITDKPYMEPVEFLVFGKHEDPNDSHPFTAYRNQTNIYKVGWVYEEEGVYFIRVTFTDSLGTHNVLFELNVGNKNNVWLYLLVSVTIIIFFAAIIGIIRKKQKMSRIKNK